ncbi:MAG: hypothetical protein U0528_18260 [Anaerolineae bacterium]
MNSATTIRIKLVILATLIGFIGYCSAQLLIPELEVIFTPALNITYFLESMRRLITFGSILFFAALVMVATLVQLRRHMIEQEAETQISRQRRMVIAWGIGVLLVAVPIISLTVYIDPRGLYESKHLGTYSNPSRRFKTWNYPLLEHTPQIVIFGSSRAFSVSPEHIRQVLGVSAFNVAIESGKLNDFVVQARLILEDADHRLPEVLMIEVTDGFIDNFTYTQMVAPLRWLRYLPTDQAVHALQERLNALINRQSFAEALMMARLYLQTGRGLNGWQFKADGEGFIDWTPNDGLVLQAARDAIPIRIECPQMNPGGIVAFNALAELAAQQGSSIVFYIPPPHPIIYAANIDNNENFERCAMPFRDFVSANLPKYDNMFLLDFRKLESIGGVDTALGYYDGVHMTSYNNNLLIDAAADTLREALRISVEKRQQLGLSATDPAAESAAQTR